MSQERINVNGLRFVTNGTMSRDTYTVLADVFMRKDARTRRFGAVSLLSLIFAVWQAAFRAWGYFAVFLVLTLLCGILLILKRRNFINELMRQLREICGGEQMNIFTGFAEDVFYIENCQTGRCIGVAYSDISFMYNTPNYIFLITKDKKVSMVFKECLTGIEIKSLVAFLDEKGVQQK